MKGVADCQQMATNGSVTSPCDELPEHATQRSVSMSFLHDARPQASRAQAAAERGRTLFLCYPPPGILWRSTACGASGAASVRSSLLTMRIASCTVEFDRAVAACPAVFKSISTMFASRPYAASSKHSCGLGNF